jgi:hypothetical protein
MEKKLKNAVAPYTKEVVNNTLSLKVLEILKDTVKMKLQVQLNSQSEESEKKIRRIINQSIINLKDEEKK